MGSLFSEEPAPVVQTPAPMVQAYKPQFLQPPTTIAPAPVPVVVNGGYPTTDYSKPLFNPSASVSKEDKPSYLLFQPVVTELKNKGYTDLQVKNIIWNLAEESQGKLVREKGNSSRYAGGGFAQITGEENYKKIGKRLGIDLVGNPNLTTDPKWAAKIAAEYFDMRADERYKGSRKIYDTPEGVIKELAPKDRVWGNRLARLKKNGWGEPTEEDVKSPDAEADAGYFSEKKNNV